MHAAADSFTLTVISKSASIWSEPSTGSKKLGSVSYGESLTGVSSDGGNNVAMDRNFYEVEYNGRQGWVGATYVVRNTLEISADGEQRSGVYRAGRAQQEGRGSTEQNDPLPRHRVLRRLLHCPFRGAACAYTPKDAAHYDTKFIGLYQTGGCATAGSVNTARSSAPARMTVIPKSRR